VKNIHPEKCGRGITAPRDQHAASDNWRDVRFRYKGQRASSRPAAAGQKDAPTTLERAARRSLRFMLTPPRSHREFELS
jgi:hypothetical protein